MKVSVNSHPFELTDGATLADALSANGIKQEGIATALNGSVVPASDRNTTVLNDGDSILIIKAFCGG